MRCPICQQPVDSDYPEAEVYHVSCLEKKMQPQRDRLNAKSIPTTIKQEGKS